MAKVSVTYIAPKDDSPVVYMAGKRFIDGQALDIDDEADGDLLQRLRTNQHFEVSDAAAEPAPAPAQQQGSGWNQ